jgi:hypothetical protein
VNPAPSELAVASPPCPTWWPRSSAITSLTYAAGASRAAPPAPAPRTCRGRARYDWSPTTPASCTITASGDPVAVAAVTVVLGAFALGMLVGYLLRRPPRRRSSVELRGNGPVRRGGGRHRA